MRSSAQWSPLCLSAPQQAGVEVVGTGDSVWDGLNLLVTFIQVPPWRQDLVGEVGGGGESDGGGGESDGDGRHTVWGLLWT